MHPLVTNRGADGDVDQDIVGKHGRVRRQAHEIVERPPSPADKTGINVFPRAGHDLAQPVASGLHRDRRRGGNFSHPVNDHGLHG